MRQFAFSDSMVGRAGCAGGVHWSMSPFVSLLGNFDSHVEFSLSFFQLALRDGITGH